MTNNHRSALEEAMQELAEEYLDSLAWGFVLVATIWALPLAAAYAYGHVLDRVTPTPGFDPREQR